MESKPSKETAPWMREAAFDIWSELIATEGEIAFTSPKIVAIAQIIAKHAEECTAPAPQPANEFSDSDWKWWFDLTAEGRLSMIRQFRAATPQVTPTLQEKVIDILDELTPQDAEATEPVAVAYQRVAKLLLSDPAAPEEKKPATPAELP